MACDIGRRSLPASGCRECRASSHRGTIWLELRPQDWRKFNTVYTIGIPGRGGRIDCRKTEVMKNGPDIDLTYLPVAGRPESLAAINAGMKRMAVAIGRGIPGVKVNEVANRAAGIVTKLTLKEPTPRSRSKSLPSFAAASSIPRCDPYVRASRRALALQRHRSSRFPTSNKKNRRRPLPPASSRSF
ncbi:hypothetical protein ACVJGD_007988 [Bradyrhizobium sp. USDA 10063]